LSLPADVKSNPRGTLQTAVVVCGGMDSVSRISGTDRMRPKIMILVAILALSALVGFASIVIKYSAPGYRLQLQVVAMIVQLGLVFVWLRNDDLETGYRRSPLLNIGIVGLTVVFLPIYFFKSRPRGARLASVLASLGAMLASSLLTVGGALLALLVI
jgi:hypothetical protein